VAGERGNGQPRPKAEAFVNVVEDGVCRSPTSRASATQAI
jgi:hypothetical protein